MLTWLRKHLKDQKKNLIKLVDEITDKKKERFFEVWIGKDNIDVITRFADEFTNVVANGFSELVARCATGVVPIGKGPRRKYD